MRVKELPTTYVEAQRALNGRRSRTLANNTTAIDYGSGVIALKLHATDVVTFTADGRIILNSGGWQTVTTQSRLNHVLRAHGYTVGSNGARSWAKRHWIVSDFTGESETVDYHDGLTIREREITWNGDAWRVVKRHGDAYGDAKPFDHVEFVIAYESGSLSEDEIVEGFGELVRSGLAWQLQGHYGRTAQALIEAGLIQAV